VKVRILLRQLYIPLQTWRNTKDLVCNGLGKVLPYGKRFLGRLWAGSQVV
jgi:hypothetical protein